MKPAAAWGTVALAALATAAAFLLPPEAALVLLVVAVAGLRRPGPFLGATAVAVALNVAFFALLLPGRTASLGPLGVSPEGAWRGLVGAVRLAAAAGANLAILTRIPLEPVLDGLRLGRGPTAFLAAVLASAHDLGRDLGRLVDARRLDGAWPRGRLARVRAAAGLLPPLVVVAVRRAQVRRDALRLAGHDTAPRFAALVAVTALAVAGRMAFVALPNVSLTYVLVFLGGLLFGAWTGALAGLLSMALTDVMLTGLQPSPFANAPAMAVVGLLGALVGRLRVGREHAPAVALVAAACGAVATLLFSVLADLLTWLVVPEFRADPATLRPLVVAGLAFNAVSAAVNAVLFAAAVGPVARAAEAAGLTRLTETGHSRPPDAPSST